jgi:omega-6 fatty acid desaturase (delta-12 desaturase)
LARPKCFPIPITARHAPEHEIGGDALGFSALIFGATDSDFAAPKARLGRPHFGSPSFTFLFLTPSDRAVIAKSGDFQMQQIDELPSQHQVTFKTLKEAIPVHCFHRSHRRSFTYLAINLVAVAFVGASAGWLGTHAWFWPFYVLIQGCLFTGIWVIAHECGHRAFSPSDRVNDMVGWVLHSALLVPYHAWRISHGKHHRYTNHLQLDEVFVPQHYTPPNTAFRKFVNYTVPGRLLTVVFMLLIGWPAYLLINTSGRKYPRLASHWLPSSPIFQEREWRLIVLSDLGVALTVVALACWAFATSIGNVLLLYGLPYLVANAWLVLITYLQHTDADVPHFDQDEWTWLKGALCTVDRDFGVLNHVFHHITDTHICHHLFPKIPHYHAVEATAALSRVLGDQYRYDRTHYAVALWRNLRDCVLIRQSHAGDYLWEDGKPAEDRERAGLSLAKAALVRIDPPGENGGEADASIVPAKNHGASNLLQNNATMSQPGGTARRKI